MRGRMKLGTLDYGVLLRVRRVSEGYVCYRAVATHEVRTLAMDME
jgi:hypothetical protein